MHTLSLSSCVSRRVVRLAAAALAFSGLARGADLIPAAGSKMAAVPNKVITAADVAVEKVGTTIPASAIGEPVSGVTLQPAQWVEATDTREAFASIDGAIAPVDPNGKMINFRVILPASWNHRSIQRGGSGNNGTITVTPGRGGEPGYAEYGSDSGHQAGGAGRGRAGAAGEIGRAHV